MGSSSDGSQHELRIRHRQASGAREGGTYGPPTFSPIPLPLLLAPPDLPLRTSGFTDHRVFQARNLRVQSALAVETQYGSQSVAGGNEGILSYSSFVRLGSQSSGGPLPVGGFTPETFPTHLGLVRSDSPFNFLFAERFDSPGRSTSIGYSGTATLVDVDVVPEPATLLLAGSGLALVARYRKRLRKSLRS